jgi:hypothetical protein
VIDEEIGSTELVMIVEEGKAVLAIVGSAGTVFVETGLPGIMVWTPNPLPQLHVPALTSASQQYVSFPQAVRFLFSTVPFELALVLRQ